MLCKTLKIALFACIGGLLCSSPILALDQDNGGFIFISQISKEDQNGKTTYSFKDGERNFKFQKSQLQNNKALLNVLENASESDKGIRFSGTWEIQNGKKILNPANLKAELINGEKDCPEIIYATKTVTGTFIECVCGDFCHTTIKDSQGQELELFGDTTDIFGEKSGPKVSVKYQTAQAWLDTGDWGMCVIDNFFESGKIVK